VFCQLPFKIFTGLNTLVVYIIKKKSVYNMNTASNIQKSFSADVEGYRHFAKLQPTEKFTNVNAI